MSQVIFLGDATKAEGGPRRVRVQGGWDEPLRTYYLVVTDAETDELIFDSSESDWEEEGSLAAVEAELDRLGVVPPSQFLSWVAPKARNRTATYTRAGWVTL